MRIETIILDEPIKVNRQEYDYLMGTDTKRGAYTWAMAGRIDKRGQCFVKVWFRSIIPAIKKYLNRNEKIS